MPHADHLDSLGVDLIVSDDLSELREMPSIPFPEPHHVVIHLLIQIIQ